MAFGRGTEAHFRNLLEEGLKCQPDRNAAVLQEVALRPVMIAVPLLKELSL